MDSLDSLLSQARRLRFADPALEARYHAERLEAARHRIRLLAGLGVIVLCAIGYFNLVSPPSPWRTISLLMRYGVMAPLWTALVVATWWRGFLSRAEAWIAFIIVVSLVAHTFGQGSGLVATNRSIYYFFMADIAPLAIILLIAMPLRFRWALAATVAGWIACVGAICWMLPRAGLDAVPTGAINAALLFIGTLAIVRVREADDRRVFAQREHVRRLHAELELANRQKDRLFAVIGHDIRGPLSAIALNSAVGTRGGDATALQEISGDIHTSARQLLGLLDNLLDWARLQSGGAAVRAEEIALAELAVEIVKLYEPVARHAGVTLTTDIPPGLQVRADRPMLATILRNLTGNALKAAPAGSRVRIAACSAGILPASPDGRQDAGATPRRRIQISVTDTGPGLTPEKLAALGLARSKPLPADAAPRGLGLVVCREFAQKLNGELWAESTPGRGTTVFFALSPDDRESF